MAGQALHLSLAARYGIGKGHATADGRRLRLLQDEHTETRAVQAAGNGTAQLATASYDNQIFHNGFPSVVFYYFFYTTSLLYNIPVHLAKLFCFLGASFVSVCIYMYFYETIAII